MHLTTTVALNTSLADLDVALRTLLRRELGQVGFERVAIAFDAPNREWASTISQPTMNLFLYDLRENRQRRKSRWDADTENGSRIEVRPPLWLDVSYTLTAFSRAVEDEHRLLSQALTALSCFPELPEEVLPGPLAALRQQFGALTSRLGDPRSDATPEFWTSVGGPYKLSFNYIVTLPFPSGTQLHRGPPVRSQRLRVGDLLGRRAKLEEHTRVAGRLLGADGSGAGGAWAVLVELGRVCETDEAGWFSFLQVPPGSYTVRARDRDGREATGTLTVPGDGPSLTVRLH